MGRRSGEKTRLSPIWPGFKSWRRRHMCLEFVVGSLIYSEPSNLQAFVILSRSKVPVLS